jgi:hypothetical protein
LTGQGVNLAIGPSDHLRFAIGDLQFVIEASVHLAIGSSAHRAICDLRFVICDFRISSFDFPFKHRIIRPSVRQLILLPVSGILNLESDIPETCLQSKSPIPPPESRPYCLLAAAKDLALPTFPSSDFGGFSSFIARHFSPLLRPCLPFRLRILPMPCYWPLVTRHHPIYAITESVNYYILLSFIIISKKHLSYFLSMTFWPRADKWLIYHKHSGLAKNLIDINILSLLFSVI